MRTPVDLVGGFYTDDSLPWSCQDTVNYIPVAAEAGGTRTVSKLVDAPGLKPWQWIGNVESGVESAPIRGLHDVEGQLFVVCGRTLYQISNAGVAIPRGTIPGVGRVSMAHNQRSTGNELIVVNGSGGYVWNTGTQTFSVVTDAGYPGASVVDFIDGYLMQVEPFGRFLFHSDLADALEYNTLDRFEAETAPDRTLGMIVNHQEVWAFGERTIDVFGNVGTAQGTFQNKGVSISRGCAAKWTPAVIDNGVAWLGDDLKVYHANGYSPVRISTRAIEVALSECSRTDLRNAFSFVWEDLSHAVYYLTIPNGPTFGYDFSTGLWHRRASWHPERDVSGRWRLSDLVKSNGRWIGGDYQTGKLYELDWDYMMEGCDPLVRERISPVAHNDGRRFTVDSVETFFETGGKETECIEFPRQPEGPSISGAAPDGQIGTAYPGYAYTVTAGDAAIVAVVIVGGSMPPGLTFDEGDIEVGDPTDAGSFTITMRVTDANGLWAEHTDTIEISTYFRIFGVGTGGATIRWSDKDNPWDPTRYLTAPLSAGLLHCGGGKLIAVGTGAVASYDIDAETWTTGTTDASGYAPTSMIFTGDEYLYATGILNTGTIFASSDGINFTSRLTVGGVRQVCGLAIRGDVVIGVVQGGGPLWVRSAERGAAGTWATISTPFSTSGGIYPTPYGFFVPQNGGTAIARTDDDGATWHTSSIPSGYGPIDKAAVSETTLMVITSSEYVFTAPADDIDAPFTLIGTIPGGVTSSTNDNRMVYADGSWYTGGNNDEAFTSDDDGATWVTDDISQDSAGMVSFAVEIRE